MKTCRVLITAMPVLLFVRCFGRRAPPPQPHPALFRRNRRRHVHSRHSDPTSAAIREGHRSFQCSISARQHRYADII